MVYFTVSALQLTAVKINRRLPSTTDTDGKTESRFHGAPLNAQLTPHGHPLGTSDRHHLFLFSLAPAFIHLYFMTSICNFTPLCPFYLSPHWGISLILSPPQQIEFWWLTAENFMIKVGPAALTLWNHFLSTRLTDNHYSGTNTLTQNNKTECNRYKIQHKNESFLFAKDHPALTHEKNLATYISHFPTLHWHAVSLS